MTGFWGPGVEPSLVSFPAEPEEKGLLEEMASVEPRRCFGAESMIPKVDWSRLFRVDAKEGLKRGESYWVFETGIDAGDASRKGKRAENCVKLGEHARADESWTCVVSHMRTVLSFFRSLSHTGWVDGRSKAPGGPNEASRHAARQGFGGGKIGFYS